MADQTSITRDPRANNQDPSLIGNVTGFTNNVLSLAELQGRLTLLELSEVSKKAAPAVALLAGSAAFALVSLPVLLIGLAELLVWLLEWQRAVAYLAVAGFVLVVSGIGVLIALGMFRGRGLNFPRSRDELTRNWQWVRTVLLHSGRPLPRGRQ